MQKYKLRFLTYRFPGIILILVSLSFFFLNQCQAQRTSFEKFLLDVITVRDSLSKSRMFDTYLSQHSLPLIEGNTVYFIYRGKGRIVEMPCEYNRWNPDSTRMVRIPETNVFLHTIDLPPGGRTEYKYCVDGDWILDPNNPKRAAGGFGENSDVWTPGYIPPNTINVQPGIPTGRLDTLQIESKILKRKHPIFVYLPPGMDESKRIPTIYITDGGEFLAYGKMKNILDNLLFQRRIQPVIAVFIDPRTNIRVDSTNKRMTDYAASDSYLDFLEHEVSSVIERKYPATRSAKDRLIMGVSMGGLISTYAVMLRSHFVKNCAAQSPAYYEAEKAVIKLFDQVVRFDVKVYMDTGIIGDTQEEARLVSGLLKQKGATVQYAEYPEGHNWSNWRARIGTLLEYFFGTK